MRMISVFAVLMATPVAAHQATLPHAHTDWSLPVGLCLIAVAAVAMTVKARIKVRRDRK